MPTRKTSPVLMDATELAELLGITLRCVWTWTDNGKLPKPLRRGVRWTRWRRRDIERWLNGE